MLGVGASLALIGASALELPFEMTTLEAIAVVTCGWSVWLLACNQALGWWIGLIGIVAYGFLFYRVQLYAEVGIQVFYFASSIQGIYVWLRGGRDGQQRPVSTVPRSVVMATAVAVPIAVLVLQAVLIRMRGAAPFWDALTTVLSLAAQLYLIGRYTQSWYLWITVDLIYVPLYASRGLYLTALLYAVFLLMSVHGLLTFRKLYGEQLELAEAVP